MDEFVSAFVNELTAIHGDRIDYILLAGSYARGDFIRGKSDIDLTVRLKNDDVEQVRATAYDIFSRLNKKHRLAKPGSMPIILGANTCEMNLFTLLDPIHGHKRAVRRHAKITGKVLYGRNVLEGFSVDYGDPYHRLFNYSLFASVASIMLFAFNPDSSVKRCMRSLLFAFEYALYDKNDRDHELAKTVQKMKLDFETVKKWPLQRKFRFCIDAFVKILVKSIHNL